MAALPQGPSASVLGLRREGGGGEAGPPFGVFLTNKMEMLKDWGGKGDFVVLQHAGTCKMSRSCMEKGGITPQPCMERIKF